jgi:hypothetical protein
VAVAERRDQHNATIGILICGTRTTGASGVASAAPPHPKAVAAYAYDKLPSVEQQILPDDGHIMAALAWAESEPDQHVSELPVITGLVLGSRLGASHSSGQVRALPHEGHPVAALKWAQPDAAGMDVQRQISRGNRFVGSEPGRRQHGGWCARRPRSSCYDRTGPV